MSRVMVIGYGPLPQPGIKAFHGAALRTHQFFQGAREGKHEVHLYALPLHGAEDNAGGDSAELVADRFGDFEYRRFTSHDGDFAVRKLNEEVRRLKPDAVVGVTTYPSYLAAMLTTSAPLWCDLNGYWMAEIQAKCHAEDDDRHLRSAWNIERAILRRLDKFSAVSRPQLHAVLGELAGAGRLNRHTIEYPFGAHVANAAFKWPESDLNADKAKTENILRGPVVPPESFVILWSGGFKPWADMPTLFVGLNELMSRYMEVHFVATGAGISGAEQGVYHKFQEAVASSPHKERFHLLGWTDSDSLPAIYREADLGINIDGPNYETMFGGRNRINAMATENLPILTTVGTEISEWLEDAHAALVFQMGDSQSLIQAVEPWIDQREKLKDYSRRAKKMMDADFTVSETTRPLKKWLDAPHHAPDNELKIKQSGGNLNRLDSLTLNSLEELSADEGEKSQENFAPSSGSLPSNKPDTPLTRFFGKFFGRG